MKKLISNKQLNLSVALISAALVLVFVLFYSENGSPRLGKSSPLPASPEYYFVNVNSNQFDITGQLQSNIQSTQVDHIANSNNAQLRQPTFTSFEAGKPQWLTSAKEGLLYNNGERLDLQHQVLSINSSEQRRIATEAITLYPDQKRAETDLLITLTSPDSHTRSKGLQANLSNGEITLLNNVRGQYHVPPPR